MKAVSAAMTAITEAQGGRVELPVPRGWNYRYFAERVRNELRRRKMYGYRTTHSDDVLHVYQAAQRLDRKITKGK